MKKEKNNYKGGYVMSIYISTFGEITFDFTGYERRITEKGIKKFIEMFQKETGIEIDEEKEIKFESISGKLVAKTDFSYGGPDSKEFIDKSIRKAGLGKLLEYAGTSIFLKYDTVLEDNLEIIAGTVTVTKITENEIQVYNISDGNSMEYNLVNCIKIGYDYWNDKMSFREDVSEYKLVPDFYGTMEYCPIEFLNPAHRDIVEAYAKEKWQEKDWNFVEKASDFVVRKMEREEFLDLEYDELVENMLCELRNWFHI